MKTPPPDKEVSVLLPAYNEAWRIENSIKHVEKALRSFSNFYEIIVTEDGSTDGTDLIVTSLSKTNPNLRFLHSPVRLGKGKAIKRALRVAKGDIVVFMDADLATDLDYLPKIVQLVTKHRGLVIGSRHMEDSRVKRPASRALFSLGYNLFVRVFFLDGVRDHQCGFKAMSREVVDAVGNNVKSDEWFFDTELILRCKKLGFPLLEMGVQWTEPRKKEESKVKLFHTTSRLGIDLLRYKLAKKG